MPPLSSFPSLIAFSSSGSSVCSRVASSLHGSLPFFSPSIPFMSNPLPRFPRERISFTPSSFLGHGSPISITGKLPTTVTIFFPWLYLPYLFFQKGWPSRFPWSYFYPTIFFIEPSIKDLSLRKFLFSSWDFSLESLVFSHRPRRKQVVLDPLR